MGSTEIWAQKLRPKTKISQKWNEPKRKIFSFLFLIFLGVNGEERRAERSRLLSPLGFWLKLLWPTRHGMLSYTLHLALSLSCLYYTLMSCSSRWFCWCFCFLSFSAWIMVHFLLFKKKIYGKERKDYDLFADSWLGQLGLVGTYLVIAYFYTEILYLFLCFTFYTVLQRFPLPNLPYQHKNIHDS